MKTRTLAGIITGLMTLSFTFGGEPAVNAYRAMGLKAADVLTGTVMTTAVIPGGKKQVICLVTYFTGSREKRDAVNVKLAVFERVGDNLVARYQRDLGEENDGFVAHGELELMDLDTDGVNEIIFSYESFKDPLIEQRIGEVVLYEEGFLTAWTGPVEYDATKAARSVPPERRDRFVREVDYANTLRTRGITLFMNKRVIAIAGERLPESKIVQETFALRTKPAYR